MEQETHLLHSDPKEKQWTFSRCYVVYQANRETQQCVKIISFEIKIPHTEIGYLVFSLSRYHFLYKKNTTKPTEVNIYDHWKSWTSSSHPNISDLYVRILIPVLCYFQTACTQVFHQQSNLEWFQLLMSTEKESQQLVDCLLQLQPGLASHHPVMPKTFKSYLIWQWSSLFYCRIFLSKK